MQIILARSLAILMLFQSFGIAAPDVAQIDDLIEHAQFHKQQYGDNLLVFLSKHYGELKAEHSEKHKQEPEDHKELPFQQQTQSITVTNFLLARYSTQIANPNISVYRIDGFYYQPLTTTLFANDLLQPPRQS